MFFYWLKTVTSSSRFCINITHLNESETLITVMSELFFSEGFSLGHVIITTIINWASQIAGNVMCSTLCLFLCFALYCITFHSELLNSVMTKAYVCDVINLMFVLCLTLCSIILHSALLNSVMARTYVSNYSGKSK